MKIHVLSDVHLEKRPYNQHIPHGQLLFLCGDIGDPFSQTYLKFIEGCAHKFHKVFIICGNNEYYNRDMSHVSEHLYDVFEKMNAKLERHVIIFLDNESYNLNDKITVIGSTLWTHIRQDPEGLDVFNAVPGLRSIHDINTLEDYNAIHASCLTYIKEQVALASYHKRKVIVMTHHPPVLTCGDPKHASSPLCQAFKNDLGQYITDNSQTIMAWLYGHDHYSMNFKIRNTVVASNQRPN